MENQKELSKVFCDAVKKLAENPENLENLELYLSNHFETWLKKFAYDSANLAYELKMFAEMEI